jgi:multicomponent Na+:H+ antiporter subunit E
MGSFVIRFALTAAVLLAVWWVLSGRFDLLHFGTGVVTALAIAANTRAIADSTRFRAARFARYVPWLIGQIVLSNLRVARLVFSRRMRIAPAFINMAPGVAGSRALTMLGGSITLTPGTLTIDVSPDDIFVHALDTRSAQDTRDHVIAREVAQVFVERDA